MRNAVCLIVSLFKHPGNGAASERIAVCLFTSLFKHPDNLAASMRIAVCTSIPLMNTLVIALPQ